MIFGYYSKIDLNEEIISKTITFSRLQAAKVFSSRKNLPLKKFLGIFSIKKL
jgi:hypothetical protein